MLRRQPKLIEGREREKHTGTERKRVENYQCNKTGKKKPKIKS